MNLDFLKTLPKYWLILIAYLFIVNIVSFIIYGADKFYATSKHRRVPEKKLLLLALLGGSLGAIIGMNFFRHKTRKNSFLIWFIIIFLCQLTLLWYLINKLWMNVG